VTRDDAIARANAAPAQLIRAFTFRHPSAIPALDFVKRPCVRPFESILM
jgi:hypothetical protein